MSGVDVDRRLRFREVSQVYPVHADYLRDLADYIESGGLSGDVEHRDAVAEELRKRATSLELAFEELAGILDDEFRELVGVVERNNTADVGDGRVDETWEEYVEKREEVGGFVGDHGKEGADDA